MINLTDAQRRWIVIGIGALFILMGIAQALFKFDNNHWLVKEGSYFLMMAAAILLLSGRKKAAPTEEAKEDPEQAAGGEAPKELEEKE